MTVDGLDGRWTAEPARVVPIGIRSRRRIDQLIGCWNAAQTATDEPVKFTPESLLM
jgi:hypothetical protein